jgi:transcriptional regulator with XRE-family HTH domain
MTETEFLMKIGARIKAIRLEKKISQVDLALLCKFEKASMSRIESGLTNPTVLTLYKISRALEIPYYNLFIDLQ